MTEISVLGIDLAKNIFQVHGVDVRGKKVLSKRLSRKQFTEFMVNLPICRIAMEARGGSHYWARNFKGLVMK